MKMCFEPITGEVDHRFQCSRLLEKMRRTRHNLQPFRPGEAGERVAVKVKHGMIGTADDQEHGHTDLLKRFVGKIRPATTGYDGGDVRSVSRSDQRRCGTGAGTEEADGHVSDFVMGPVKRLANPRGEQRDVKDIIAVCGLGLGQQVEEKRREATGTQGIRDVGVAWTKPAAATAMSKDDKAARRLRNDKFAFQPSGADAGLAPLHCHVLP
mgnify:CR=1 FL=1